MWPYLLAGFASAGQGVVYPDVLMPAAGVLQCTNAVSVTVAARALTTGDLEGANCSGNWTDRGDWVSNKGPLFISTDFEIMLTVDSGPNPTFGNSIGVWLTINSSITWGWSATPGEFNSGQWTMDIRQITDTVNTDSTVWTWTTEDAA